MKIVAFLFPVIVLLFAKGCNSVDQQFIKTVIDSVYKAGSTEGTRLKRQLFLTAVWPEVSKLIPESVKIPNFRGNVGMNDYIYATKTNICPIINDIFYVRYLSLDFENYVEAVFSAQLYFKTPVNFVIHKEDSSGHKSTAGHASYTFNGENYVKFWLKIPDFSGGKDKIPQECVVYIDSFDIEFLSEPTIDESELKDNEAKKMVKQFWDIVKQGDIQKMMRMGIMKALQNNLYPDTSRTTTGSSKSKVMWACLSDQFINNIYNDVQGQSNGDEDTHEDDEFRLQIEYLQHDKDVLYEKINTAEFIDPVQRGIEKSINGLLSQPKRKIRDSDYTYNELLSFTSDMAGMKKGQPNFSFITFAPVVFMHLREFLGFTEDKFLASFCQVPLTELANPGKSGSGLYLSQDQYFIAKTVQKVEADVLQTFLSGYFNNIHQNPDTLVPKFFGFYQYKQSSNIDLRLIVMNNIMPPNVKIDRKYDLKGSLFHREVSEEKKRKPSVTFKDLEFLDHHEQGIYLKASDHARLMQIIESDCTLLQTFQVIDYSLLLGIHYEDGLKGGDFKVPVIDENNLPCEVKTFKKSESNDKIQNGITAYTANGEKVMLYIGIIDILQNYRLKKRFEHYWKSVIFMGKEFSVVDPEYYALRFKNFMEKRVFKKMLPCPPSKPSLNQSGTSLGQLMAADKRPRLGELMAADKRPRLGELMAADKRPKLGELMAADKQGRRTLGNFLEK